MDRMRATSFICLAISGQCSAIWTPGTAVSMALVGPPVEAPGFGSKVSNCEGPPCMNSRMQERPFLRSSSAWRRTASIQPSALTPAAPAAAVRRKARRLSWPRVIRRKRSWIGMGISLLQPQASACGCNLALRLEFGRVHQHPQDVFKRLGPLADLLDVLAAPPHLARRRLAAQRPQVDLL